MVIAKYQMARWHVGTKAGDWGRGLARILQSTSKNK